MENNRRCQIPAKGGTMRMRLTRPSLFQNIQIKLSTLNATAIFCLFIIYSVIFHSYFAYRVYNKIDDNMQFEIKGFYRAHESQQSHSMRMPMGLLPTVYIRDENDRYFDPHPTGKIPPETIEILLAEPWSPGGRTVRVLDNYYRIFRQSFPPNEYPILWEGTDGYVTKELVALADISSEADILGTLLQINIAGGIAGAVLFALISYYMTRKLLRTIKTAWERQRQFVADASHELRTPLAVIKSNAELTLHNPGNTIEKESERIAAIINQSTRMGRLVSSLLTLARADSDELELNLRPVLLDDIVADVTRQFQILAASKNITIGTDIEKDIAMTGDNERLFQLLVILLDNAVKFTPAGGSVRVTCTKKADSVELIVKDTGIGIAESDLPLIFHRFYRADKSRSGNDGSYGLGLSIGQWIVNKHGGKIKVESTVGVGTEFRISFPIK
ncbi:MAG: HAMP domain-containing sensor histidine kinase [Sporomusaceae bacterium]|nr:HAMP domain-containing sensor histidine kinase [Sporomusaceae bacterium]